MRRSNPPFQTTPLLTDDRRVSGLGTRDSDTRKALDVAFRPGSRSFESRIPSRESRLFVRLLSAEFVTSVDAGGHGIPRDGVAQVSFVGRSNVGKSSLINALARQRLARTSAAPGKTRLANIYRVARGSGKPFYLVDLPGYGFAVGEASEFARLVGEYFDRPARVSSLLVVDARHPGLQNDLSAWTWLKKTVDQAAIVVTKIDKLARGERIRAMREFESVFEHPVLPFSAATGEGLEELWKLIDRLANSQQPNPRRSSLSKKATAPPLRKK